MNGSTIAHVRCAWCGAKIGPSPTVEDSHGICLACLPGVFGVPVEDLGSLTRDDLDCLPFGIVRLDEHDVVIAYNRAEASMAHLDRERVMGRNFFREVAPCTDVRELAGWIREARRTGESARTELDFVFRFPFGEKLVSIVLAHDAHSRATTLLVREVQSRTPPAADRGT